MIQIWNRYKTTVRRNCMGADPGVKNLSYWRDVLFTATVTYLIPLSMIALMPGVYMTYSTGLTGLLIIDAVVVPLALSIAFVPGMSVFARKFVFSFELYLLSIGLLYYLGPIGPGLMYLYASAIFIILIFETRVAVLTLAGNTLICAVAGIAIYYDYGGSPLIEEYTIGPWIAASSNLVFLNAVALFLIPKLFNGLHETVMEQERLKQELHENKEDLEHSVKLLNEKNRELEEFAYITSHDLKEPLRMIRSFMDLLSKEYKDILDEKGRIYIGHAVNGAEKMTNLIDDLLQYSRAGRSDAEKKEINLNYLFQALKQNFEEAGNKRKPEIMINNLPAVNAVPVSMWVLFQNLISNGLKYQNGKNFARVTISCRNEGGYWKFSVSDNGIGIDGKYHENIFQFFRRRHLDSEFKGTGMELAICKKVVEQHGGEIWVESEPEKGSTFYFSTHLSEHFLILT